MGSRQDPTTKLDHDPPIKLYRLGIRTGIKVDPRTAKVIRTLAAVIVVGSTTYAGIKAINQGMEKLANLLEPSAAKVTELKQQKLIDAPRHNYQVDFKAIKLQGKTPTGDSILMCGLKHQGHNLELITGVHFMEMSNEARRYGIDFKITAVQGSLNNALQIEGNEAIAWVKQQGLLFGFTSLKDKAGQEVQKGLFEFNRDQATKDYLSLADNLRPTHAKGSVFGILQQLKMPDSGITIPFENKDFTDYFTSAGLVHGFVPQNFKVNQPETSYTYVYDSKLAHKLLSDLSSEGVNSFKFCKLQGTLWNTIENQYPYLSSQQVGRTVDLALKINKLLDPSFNPTKLQLKSQLVIPDLQSSETQLLLSKAVPTNQIDQVPTVTNAKKHSKVTEVMNAANLSKLAVTDDGLYLIKTFEAFREARYLCQGGVPTIGYGCTRPNIVNGPELSEPQAVAVLSQDLDKHVKRVKQIVKDKVLAELTPNQFAALVSFDFNTGALDKSTLCAELNKGNMNIGAYLCLFNKVRENGSGEHVFSKGLFRRRLSEMLLYYGAKGADSYITPDSYDQWAKELAFDPDVKFKDKNQEKVFVASMIGKAQQERIKNLEQLVKN